MIWIDYTIGGLIGLSALIGFMRGFIKEAFSLAIWMAAGWVGLSFSREFAVYLTPVIAQPSGRIAASFGILFLTTLLLGSLVSYLAERLVVMTGFGGTDRLIGLLFGAVRGALIVSVMVLLAGATPLPQDPWWKESKLIPPFQKLALWLRDRPPNGLAGYVNYR